MKFVEYKGIWYNFTDVEMIFILHDEGDDFCVMAACWDKKRGGVIRRCKTADEAKMCIIELVEKLNADANLK